MPKVRIMVDEDGETKIAVMISLKEAIGVFTQNVSSIEPMIKSAIMSMAGGFFGKKEESGEEDQEAPEADEEKPRRRRRRRSKRE